MTRHYYLASYDIADDKRRNRVFRILQDHGDHLQYSVFMCELNERELTRLRGLVSPHIHATKDQLIILHLGTVPIALESALECLGRQYCPPTRVQIV